MVHAGKKIPTVLVKLMAYFDKERYERFYVYIVYRMHKVERIMVKTNAMNTQGDNIICTITG